MGAGRNVLAPPREHQAQPPTRACEVYYVKPKRAILTRICRPTGGQERLYREQAARQYQRHEAKRKPTKRFRTINAEPTNQRVRAGDCDDSEFYKIDR